MGEPRQGPLSSPSIPLQQDAGSIWDLICFFYFEHTGAWEMLFGDSGSNKIELHPLPKALIPLHLALFIYKGGHISHILFQREGVVQGLLYGHVPITGEETEAQEGQGCEQGHMLITDSSSTWCHAGPKAGCSMHVCYQNH